MPKYRHVLAASAYRQVIQPVNQRDVIIAIVGGTLLALALSRPRLRWLEQLTERSSSQRLWAERALTGFFFAMGGYAWASLFMVLHKQLNEEVRAMLTGASIFIVAYAALVHFEPFVSEWRSGGGLGAVALYVCIAGAAVLLGAELAIFAIEPWLKLLDVEVISLAAGFTGLGLVLYRYVREPPSAPACGEGDSAL